MKPVLMITDIGWEIDDQLALAYICGSQELELAGVVTTAYYPEENAPLAHSIMDWLDNGDRPVGIGTRIEEICQSREFEPHEGTFPGMWKEPKDGYQDGQDLIQKLVKEYGSELCILVTAPMTDAAEIEDFKGELYIQCSAKLEDKRLVPDSTSHNVRADIDAAEKIFNLNVPKTLCGKYAAYEVSLDHQDFFDWIHHPIGYYLNTESLKIVDFMWNNPELYQKIYGGMDDQVLSAPYDAVAAISIARPEMFDPEFVGKHKLIGMQEGKGVHDPQKLKEHLLEILSKSMQT